MEALNNLPVSRVAHAVETGEMLAKGASQQEVHGRSELSSKMSLLLSALSLRAPGIPA